MSSVEYFVALSFVPGEMSELVQGRAIAASCPAEAKELAAWLAKEDGGAVAFSRRGNPDVGSYKDAKILGAYGDVPDDISEQVHRQIDIAST